MPIEGKAAINYTYTIALWVRQWKWTFWKFIKVKHYYMLIFVENCSFLLKIVLNYQQIYFV